MSIYYAVLVAKRTFLCAFKEEVIVGLITFGLLDRVEAAPDKDIVVPLVIGWSSSFASNYLGRVRLVIVGDPFVIKGPKVAAIDKKVMGKNVGGGITSDTLDALACYNIVVNQNRAVVHLKEERLQFSVINNIACNPEGLVVGVDPYPKTAYPTSAVVVFLFIDSTYQVVFDDRVHTIVQFDRSSLLTAKLTAVIGVFNEIAFDQRACGASKSCDT